MKKKLCVLKFGTGVLTDADSGNLNNARFRAISAAVAHVQSKCDIIIVTSAAVSGGLAAMGCPVRPTELIVLQACAAIGQTKLMHEYEAAFRLQNLAVAQILVDAGDFRQEQRRNRFLRTVETLLARGGVVPIINENDTVAVEELRYGDNDVLSAQVATTCAADLLVLLTSVDGLYAGGSTATETLIDQVKNIDEVLGYAGTDVGERSVGGMQSKLNAVELATKSGIECMIANGNNLEQLEEIIDGHGRGTRFVVTG